MKKLIMLIVSIICFLGSAVSGIGYFMNKKNILKYQETGKTIPAQIFDKDTYDRKISKKGKTKEVNMVSLKFFLNGNPGTAYVSEYIGATEMETYKEGQTVELVYLPDSVYVSPQKQVTFIRPVMLKNTIQVALDRLSYYPYFIFGFLIGGIIFFIVYKKV